VYAPHWPAVIEARDRRQQDHDARVAAHAYLVENLPGAEPRNEPYAPRFETEFGGSGWRETAWVVDGGPRGVRLRVDCSAQEAVALARMLASLRGEGRTDAASS
jgi:hypothetical protein